MTLVRYRTRDDRSGIGLLADDTVHHLSPSMAELLRGGVESARAAYESVRTRATETYPLADVVLLPPIDGRMEVWAAGVTYLRSREARMEESGDADVYQRVYESSRPELFLKSVPWRVVGDGEPVGVRVDSPLNVPEPELAVVADHAGRIVGYCVCNDMSSRSIEGANPLYLPQAKIYRGSCALSLTVVPEWQVPDPYALTIEASITRGRDTIWSDRSSTSRLHRRLDDLIAHLYACQDFPDGVMLSTGTGLVPDLGVSAQPGDVIRVWIEGVGTLENAVVVVGAEVLPS